MILFRPMDVEIPEYWEPGIHWQVEWFPDDAEAGAPYGVAWVSDYRAGWSGLVYLDYLLVRDDRRRRGIGTDLVRACRERWPGLRMDPVTDAGEAFLAAFDGQPRAMGSGRGLRGTTPTAVEPAALVEVLRRTSECFLPSHRRHPGGAPSGGTRVAESYRLPIPGRRRSITSQRREPRRECHRAARGHPSPAHSRSR